MDAIRRVFIASLGCLLLSAANAGFAQQLATEEDCDLISGAWSKISGNGLVSRCTVSKAHTLGNTLEIYPGVQLYLPNGGWIDNASRIVVLGSGELMIDGGSVQNRGAIELLSNGRLMIATGSLSNVSGGLIEINGRLTNKVSTAVFGGIYNQGQINLIRGGELHNAGRFMSSIPNGAMDIDDRSTFINLAGGYLEPRATDIYGRFLNQYGGRVSIAGRMKVKAGGSLVNTGLLEVSGPSSQWSTIRGDLAAEAGSVFENVGGGDILIERGDLLLAGTIKSNRGDWTLFPSAEMTVAAGSRLELENRGSLTVGTNSVVNNHGGIVIGCFSGYRVLGVVVGNPVMRSLCKDVDIVPWPPFQLGL